MALIITRNRKDDRWPRLPWKDVQLVDRLDIARAINAKEIRASELVTTHGWAKRTLNKLAQSVRSDVVVHGRRGAPSKIATPIKQKFVEVMQHKQDTSDLPGTSEYEEMVHAAVKKTFVRNKKASSQAAISKTTEWRLKKELKIVKIQPQVVAHHRVEARADGRNDVSWMGVLDALNEGQTAAEHGNHDSTTYKIGYEKKAMTIKVENKKVPDAMQEDSDMALFIKLWVGVTALGYYARPFYVIASPLMPKGEIDIYEVRGLNSSTAPGAFGIVCFVQTRGGNDKMFYRQLEEMRLLMHESREDLPDNEKRARNAIVTMDGEAGMVKLCMQSSVVAMMQEAKIRLVKLAASKSLDHQACDRMKDFMMSKRAMKCQSQSFEPCKVLVQKLLMLFAEHRRKYKDSISAERARRFIEALGRINAARKKVCRGDDIMKGFEDAHQFPQTYESFLRLCNTPWTDKEQETAERARNSIRQCFVERGQCTEAEMDAFGIKSMYEGQSRKLPKDQRVLWHQRAVDLHHPETLERWADYCDATKTKTRREKRKQPGYAPDSDEEADGGPLSDDEGDPMDEEDEGEVVPKKQKRSAGRKKARKVIEVEEEEEPVATPDKSALGYFNAWLSSWG